MLFNSGGFVFGFLPLVLLGFWVLQQHRLGRYACGWIGGASIIFYAMWDWHYLPLLLGSIIFNFAIGQALCQQPGRRWVLILGLVGNLGALGWFKYANFIAANLFAVGAINASSFNIILPLGISFLTFVQIAFIVDAYRGAVGRLKFVEYVAFVTFFPHLIAGPILNHKNMMPQFHALASVAYDWHKAAIGVLLFAIGLVKKIILADEFAQLATPIFAAADAGTSPSMGGAWQGMLSYSLQLYFDFSAYSDMAIGIGLMFGIRLPDNFNSPYKATSIIDFWRRWHISLSLFLRDYLYIPLGGNRRGEARRYANLITTMVLGGLWHGAGWNFVIWGGLHGVYLSINHLWQRVLPAEKAGRVRRLLGWVVCLLAVMWAWVFFRAESVAGAMRISNALWQGAGGAVDDWHKIVIGFIIVCCMPNALQVIAHAEGRGEKRLYSFAPNGTWLGIVAVMMAAGLYMMLYHQNRISEFIYFQF